MDAQRAAERLYKFLYNTIEDSTLSRNKKNDLANRIHDHIIALLNQGLRYETTLESLFDLDIYLVDNKVISRSESNVIAPAFIMFHQFMQ